EFNNTSKPNIPGMQYSWDFGDGQTDTLRNPGHKFLSAGTYNVSLQIRYGLCKSDVSHSIEVKPAPQDEISVLNHIGCSAPFKAQFNIIGNDHVRSIWTFGDLSEPELFQKNKKIEHTYKDDGEYTVKAQLINSDGCAVERTLSQKIKIGLQDIEIKPGGYTECLPSSRIFSLEENLEDPVQSYTWTFADS